MENNNKNIADQYLYSNYDSIVKNDKTSSEEYSEFIDKIKAFEKVSSLKEAKELADKILPITVGLKSFTIGDAKCTIINKNKLFRLCVDSKSEFICYDFV